MKPSMLMLFILATAAGGLYPGVGRQLPTRQWYLLAATPTVYRSVGYPATLYSIGEKQKLHLVRSIVAASAGVEFVLAGPSFLAIGQPNVAADKLAIVNYADPSVPETVPFGAEMGTQALGAYLLDEPGNNWVVGLPCFKKGLPCLFGAELEARSGEKSRVVEPVPFTDLGNIWFSGSVGGADVGFGTDFPTLGNQGLFVYSPQGIVFIAKLTTPTASEGETPATILAADAEFVVASRNNVEAKAPTSTKLWIYDRARHTSSSLLVAGNRNRYRIFGRQLAVITSYSGYSSAPGPDGGQTANNGTRITTESDGSAFDPGEDQQRAEGTSDLPPVRSFYKHPAMMQWFPGKLSIVDLRTLHIIEYDTLQADSEILHIDDDQVLYRVNDQIFSTNISSEKLGTPTLMIQDTDVPEVHWVFWGPQAASAP